MGTACRGAEPLDQRKLLEDCDDEMQYASRCLQIFVRETQADMEAIAAAFGRNDIPGVARLAHRIKGASASIRASFLLEEAARLYSLGNRGQVAEASRCFDRLRTEFEQFKQFIAGLSAT
jgi:HPt (histidine-containing phosphotransfer) domain-containing protein